MALLSDPAQPQRFSLLAPDVAASIRQFQAMPVPAAPAQAPQRARVSGWRLLDRVLGGETVSEGLDAERARLQAEAERPQMMARQAEVLSAIQDPQERALFLGMGSPDWQTNVGMRYRPVTTAAGSRTTYGPSQGAFSVEQPTFGETGDETVRRDSMGVRPVYTRTAPSIKEGIDQSVAETGRINALNVPVGPNTDLVNPVSGQAIYQGYRAPDIQNVAPGGEALVFDENGNVINRVGSTQARPLSDADQTAIARADNQIVSLDTSLARAAAIEGQIARGELNLGVLENTGSGLRNLAGMSDQNSLNYDALLAWAKEARNAILQANTGVQTDQDAIRELDTILSSTRDERIVTAALRRFQEARSATRAALQRDIQRRQGGAAPVPNGGQAGPAAPRRLTPQEAAALPSGTRFIGTDGVERVRQ